MWWILGLLVLGVAVFIIDSMVNPQPTEEELERQAREDERWAR
jgi:hypothetical protein